MINRKPSDPNPPTVADLATHGPAACLEALREEFRGAHKRYDQYRDWTDGTVLGVAEQRIGGDGTFVRAEAGDLVLVKRDRNRGGWYAGLTCDDTAYVPRVGWNVSIAYASVRDVPCMTDTEARAAMTAAGATYDAAVCATWADISPELSSQQSWKTARPGMIAAREACEAELERIRGLRHATA
jgi:hypothetical protein